jgi:Mg2+ and Co2+ transporter CorA
MDEQDMRRHREQLAELWALMAVLRDWIKPQNQSGLEGDLEKAWLPIEDEDLATAVDERINRALANLRDLAGTLRSSFNLIHLQQLDEQRDKREKLMRRIEVVAAAFLIPTLIVGFYGANTWVPGQGAHWGFWVMIAVLVMFSALGVGLVLRWQGQERRAAQEEEEEDRQVASLLSSRLDRSSAHESPVEREPTI